jgi:hypothetical protein
LTAETYDETKASKIEQALSDIIILYYGSDCFEVEEFLSPEFTFQTQYCKSNEVNLLPAISDNEVNGSWFPIEIDASEIGQFEYSFTPDLDECSDENNLMIEIYEITTSIIGEADICSGSSTTLSADENYESYSWIFDGQILSDSDSIVISQSGVLSLSVTDANGCQAEDEILISENETIDISIDVTQPLCHGGNGSAVFVSTVDYSYSINSDTLASGTYTVIVTDNLGCSEAFDFEVIQPDMIVIDLLGNEVSVSGGFEPYNITIDTVDNIQTVTVIDGNGCQSIADFFYSNISEKDFENVRLFPNPTSSLLYLDLADVNSKVESLQLVSINGQLIRRYSKDNTVFDLSQIKNGLHILQIQLENGSLINKRILVLR